MSLLLKNKPIKNYPKNPNKKTQTIHYKDIGDYLSKETKLEIIKDAKSIQYIQDWVTINPDTDYDWLNLKISAFSVQIYSKK